MKLDEKKVKAFGDRGRWGLPQIQSNRRIKGDWNDPN